MHRKVARMSIFHVIFSLFFTLFTTALSTTTTFDGNIDSGGAESSLLNPSPPPQPLYTPSKVTPFRPSIAVIVGILTTVFSITFLLLLYVRHCKRGEFFNNNNNNRSGSYYPSSTARKNSGIDPAVIDSLPIFRFASLRGQKEGLECAVCLNKFEPTEVLRLLPKCKHAFHVECVDTWLDAHSTCPLCRYRVDPEDILLVDDCSYSRNRSFGPNNDQPKAAASATTSSSSPSSPCHGQGMHSSSHMRMSARHSSAGESRRSSSLLQVIVEKPGQVLDRTSSYMSRRSLDSWRSFNRKASNNSNNNSNSSNEIVGVGCFDRPRKDELLLEDKSTGGTEHRRLEHRIIVSGGSGSEKSGPQERWSNVEPSDLLYLKTEMILGDSRRFVGSRGSRPSVSRQGNNNNNATVSNNSNSNNNSGGIGRKIINERSVSEITGLSRFRSNEGQQRQRQQVGGAVSRWLAWISQSHSPSQPAGGVAATATAAVSTSSSSSS